MIGVKNKKITNISPPVKGVLSIVATLLLCDEVWILSIKLENVEGLPIPAKIEKFELHKKTYFDFNTCENYSAIKENRIVNEIGLKKNTVK